MRTTIWLARAGQSVLNKQRRFMGQSDSPLTAYGQLQAEAIVAGLRRQRITQVYSAPQSAILTSATEIATARGGDVVVVPAWADQAMGAWQGLTWREASQQFPQDTIARMRDPLQVPPPGGESLAQVAARIIAAWHALLQVATGERVVVVTQALPIQLVLCYLLQQPLTNHWMWRSEHGSLTGIDLYNGTPIVRCVNDVPPVMVSPTGP
jgi:broad specificity phosphatase PhoE